MLSAANLQYAGQSSLILTQAMTEPSRRGSSLGAQLRVRLLKY